MSCSRQNNINFFTKIHIYILAKKNKKYGFSQKELAELVNVTEVSMSRYISGADFFMECVMLLEAKIEKLKEVMSMIFETKSV